ncbi:SDR family NAD(P)-dependent oxidoreductase [Rhodococcus sp. BE178]|uniref:SDR family NAD(P)-dependent oxidoreductase n=1 Tax=Rhodococcus sp. BE178 TaxID=2817737 RepID=UPI003D1B86C0
MQRNESHVSVPDQSGRNFIITGGNSGLGAATARVLADRGANVILACRDTKRAQVLAASISPRVTSLKLDLTDAISIAQFAESVDTVDVVIANAGISAVPFKQTSLGFELHMATNHLGHFALIGLLLDKITDRVVVVSSMAHHFAGLLHMGTLDPNDFGWQRRRYTPFGAYCQSKLANLLFVNELHRRLTSSGRQLKSVAVHPGICRTTVGLHTESPIGDIAWKAICAVAGQSPESGCLPAIHASTVPEITGGTLVGPSGLLQIRGLPALTRPSKTALDSDLAAKLWTRSETATGVYYDL